MSHALQQNVHNFIHRGCDLACLQMSYRSIGAPYLRGLMTGLASFLRMQGHDRDEVLKGIDMALAEITDGQVTEASLTTWSNNAEAAFANLIQD